MELTQEEYQEAQLNHFRSEVNRLTQEVIALKAFITKLQAAQQEDVTEEEDVESS